MKLIKAHRKAAVAGLALVVAAITGGTAYAFWTTSGSGNGSATDGNAASIKIEPLTTSTAVYDSLYSPLPSSVVSQSYEATGTAEYGNQIALAGGGGQTLSTVVVTMDDWACQSGDWTGDSGPCVTTPGSTYSEPITLDIYAVGASNSVGSLITSDTQTFAIPYRPSANASCAGQEWLDGSGNCHNGYAFNITFNTFGGAVLPGSVIFGITYSTTGNADANENGGPTSGNPAASLNVGLTTEPSEPTVGTDPLAGTGSDYIGITDANGGGSGGGYDENYCDYAAPWVGFRYDPAPCTGTEALNYGASGSWYIPAVEFNVTDGGTIDLYPGGPAQNVDFSITNLSSTPAYIQTVSFAITPGTLPAGCDPSWFVLTQPSTADGYTVPGNSTVNFTGSGGSISLYNEALNQDACEGVTVPLTFTSN